MITPIVLLMSVLSFTSTQKTEDNLDRYIIACHTTDFECFRRQYLALRGHVLLGNPALGIPTYETYVFQYGDTGTCVQITGLEESEFLSISMDAEDALIALTISTPVHIQQIRNTTLQCVKPEKDFSSFGPYLGPLKKFSGNATIEVKFPFHLTNESEVYIVLDDESIDVVLDIPDLSNYDRKSELELKLYEWSEWAFSMVQHVDVAEHVMVPYMDQYKTLFNKLSAKRFILLYPDEKYTNLKFKLSSK